VAVGPTAKTEVKATIGVDVFLHWDKGSADDLGAALSPFAAPEFQLQMLSNRGMKVWPKGQPETFCTDHWRCRFVAAREGTEIRHADIIALLSRVAGAGFDFIKTENLCTFDGVPGFSAAQGG
jgi:isocitrate dehydrogenase